MRDPRRARLALNALIPMTTGSARATGPMYSELEGRLNGHPVRVPLLTGSLTDCVFELNSPIEAANANAAIESTADGPLAGILGYERAHWHPATSTAIRARRSSMAQHDGGRRHAAEGLRLVRQRMGLRHAPCRRAGPRGRRDEGTSR